MEAWAGRPCDRARVYAQRVAAAAPHGPARARQASRWAPRAAGRRTSDAWRRGEQVALAALATALRRRAPRRQAPALGGLASVAWPAAGRPQVFAGTIRKSPSDAREYRALTLANGLRVLLASDPEATAASAALAVHAGFYLDPAGLPGLAHFCEHMLFLGNAEFPQENSFRSFLTENGGSLNAFTEEQDTTYFFEVSPASLEGALLRFASFFKAPLFTASATNREIGAIEAEDAKNRQSDAFRLNQLSKSFASPAHPQAKFGTGNFETLSTTPGADKVSAREALLGFFQRYYDASLMALTVVGREPLASLQAWVDSFFGGIVGRGLSNPTAPWRGVNPYPPVRVAGAAQLVRAVPVAERRSVAISWPVVFGSEAARMEWFRLKPHVHVSCVLGHEGEASLLSVMKRRGLVEGLLAGVSREDDNFAVFRVNFLLTELGLRSLYDVIDAAFSVIRQLERDGIPPYIFEENRELREVQWRFLSKQPSLSVALGTVGTMQKGVGPESYLSGRLLFEEPNPQAAETAVAALIRQLTPERAQYTAVAKEFADTAASKERWYGTQYGLAPIPASKLREWENPPTLASWKVPRKNPYVPRDFALRNPQAILGERAGALSMPPALVHDNARSRVFFKPDRSFGVPKASVRMFFWLPVETVDEDAVPSRLWLLALTDRLTESFYDAAVAGVGFDVSNTVEGVSMEFAGYSDKLMLLVEEVLRRIRSFDGPNDDEFGRALDAVRREQRTFDKQQPYQYAAYVSRSAYLTPEYPIELLRQQASRATVLQARAFGSKFRDALQEVYVQALAIGNLRMADVDRLQQLLNGMRFQALPKERITRRRLAQLPAATHSMILKQGLNSDEINNAVIVTFFTDADIDSVLKCQLLQAVLQDPFYGQLRTEQQLGYIVSSQADRFNDVGRLALFVQSSVLAPAGLVDAIDSFLLRFRLMLAGMTPAQLAAYKISLVEKIVKPDERLDEERDRWWQEISLFQYRWRRRDDEAQRVTGITPAALLDFFDRVVAEGAAERRRLTSAVFAGGVDGRAALARMRSQRAAAGCRILDDPAAFCAALPKWPLGDRGPTEPELGIGSA